MIIVDFPTFLSLPAGTLFADYEPKIFGPLRVKGDTVAGVDFYALDLGGSVGADDFDHFVALTDQAEAGRPVPVPVDLQTREGDFDAARRFAVWDQDDVRRLIALLASTLD